MTPTPRPWRADCSAAMGDEWARLNAADQSGGNPIDPSTYTGNRMTVVSAATHFPNMAAGTKAYHARMIGHETSTWTAAFGARCELGQHNGGSAPPGVDRKLYVGEETWIATQFCIDPTFSTVSDSSTGFVALLQLKCTGAGNGPFTMIGFTDNKVHVSKSGIQTYGSTTGGSKPFVHEVATPKGVALKMCMGILWSTGSDGWYEAWADLADGKGYRQIIPRKFGWTSKFASGGGADVVGPTCGLYRGSTYTGDNWIEFAGYNCAATRTDAERIAQFSTTSSGGGVGGGTLPVWDGSWNGATSIFANGWDPGQQQWDTRRTPVLVNDVPSWSDQDKSLSASLNVGDFGPASTASTHRTEIVSKGAASTITAGSTYAFRFQVKLAAGFQTAPSFRDVCQWKNSGTGSPPLELAAGDHWSLQGGFNGGDNPDPADLRVLWSAPFTRLVWHDFVLQIKFATGGSGGVGYNGWVSLWHAEGRAVNLATDQVLNQYPHRTMYTGTTTYVKAGEYRASTATENDTVLHHGWVMANTVADVMAIFSTPTSSTGVDIATVDTNILGWTRFSNQQGTVTVS